MLHILVFNFLNLQFNFVAGSRRINKNIKNAHMVRENFRMSTVQLNETSKLLVLHVSFMCKQFSSVF